MSTIPVHFHLIPKALRAATEMIKAGIDIDEASRVIQERLRIESNEGIDLQEVRVVVHNGQLAVRCQLAIRCAIEMIVDSNGNCMEAFQRKEDLHVSAEPYVEDVKKPLILIADDDEGCLDVMVQMVEFLGYEVLAARDGKEAIDVFNLMKNKIDLIILDLKMPFNGEKTYTKLRKMDHHAKVLLITGYAEDFKVRALLDQKSTWLIVKPFNLNSLDSKIAYILKQRALNA